MTPSYGGPQANPFLLMGGYGGQLPQAPNPLALAFNETDLALPAAGFKQSVIPQMAAEGGFQLPEVGITDLGAPTGITQVGAVPSALGAGGGGGGWGPGNLWGALGSKDADGVTTQGWGGMAISGIGALANTYMGMKQYGLAKEQLAEGKRQYDKNYAAQKQTTNASLEDRQRARVASNEGAYESVGAYMGKNGIK